MTAARARPIASTSASRTRWPSLRTRCFILENASYLKTSKPESVSVGGVKGKQIDVVLEAPEDYYGQCGSGDCMDMWRLSTGEALWFVEGVKTPESALSECHRLL